MSRWLHRIAFQSLYHCNFGFAKAWRGAITRSIVRRNLDAGPLDSLSRLKRAAEETLYDASRFQLVKPRSATSARLPDFVEPMKQSSSALCRPATGSTKPSSTVQVIQDHSTIRSDCFSISYRSSSTSRFSSSRLEVSCPPAATFTSSELILGPL